MAALNRSGPTPGEPRNRTLFAYSYSGSRRGSNPRARQSLTRPPYVPPGLRLGEERGPLPTPPAERACSRLRTVLYFVEGMRAIVAAVYVPSAVLLIGATCYVAFLPERSGTLSFWLLACGPTFLLAGVAAVWAVREDYLAEWIAPRAGDISVALLAAGALFGIAWGVARLIMPVGSPREIWLVSLYSQLGDPRSLQLRPLAAYGGLAVVAFCEELVWRGAVTQLLAERVGSRTAWVWAVALYGLAYVPTMWSLRAGAGVDPVLVLAAVGGGALWGTIAHVFGRLLPSMLAHTLFDWAVVIMFPLWGARSHG
jgi:uncharacterized protein